MAWPPLLSLYFPCRQLIWRDFHSRSQSLLLISCSDPASCRCALPNFYTPSESLATSMEWRKNVFWLCWHCKLSSMTTNLMEVWRTDLPGSRLYCIHWIWVVDSPWFFLTSSSMRAGWIRPHFEKVIRQAGWDCDESDRPRQGHH